MKIKNIKIYTSRNHYWSSGTNLPLLMMTGYIKIFLIYYSACIGIIIMVIFVYVIFERSDVMENKTVSLIADMFSILSSIISMVGVSFSRISY